MLLTNKKVPGYDSLLIISKIKVNRCFGSPRIKLSPPRNALIKYQLAFQALLSMLHWASLLSFVLRRVSERSLLVKRVWCITYFQVLVRNRLESAHLSLNGSWGATLHWLLSLCLGKIPLHLEIWDAACVWLEPCKQIPLLHRREISADTQLYILVGLRFHWSL